MKKSRTAKKKTAKKVVAKKAARKAIKKTVKKAAKKMVKKAPKKAVKKVAKKVVKKTPRPVAVSETKAVPPVKRVDYPAVCEFLEGYMHQDFAQVHGSADAAARAFVADANADERAALLKEWRALLKATAALPADRIGDLFTHQLGGMWSPVSREEVEALLTALTA